MNSPIPTNNQVVDEGSGDAGLVSTSQSTYSSSRRYTAFYDTTTTNSSSTIDNRNGLGGASILSTGPIDGGVGGCGGGGGGSGGFDCFFDRNFCDPYCTIDNRNDHQGASKFSVMKEGDAWPSSATATTSACATSGSSARRNKGRVGNDDEYSDIVLSLGKELHGLSIKQQTQINEQIHGVYPEATKSKNNDDIAVMKPTKKKIKAHQKSASRNDEGGDEVPSTMEMSYQAYGDTSQDQTEDDEAYLVSFDPHADDEFRIPQLSEEEENDILDRLHKRLARTYYDKKVASYKKACMLAPMKYGPTATTKPGPSRDFYLRYLRSKRYDIKKASHRLIANFYYKELLFGSSKLTRDILYEDLNDDDVAALRSGHLMYLPGRDMAGRNVIVMSSRYMNRSKWIHHVSRAIILQYMAFVL